MKKQSYRKLTSALIISFLFSMTSYAIPLQYQYISPIETARLESKISSPITDTKRLDALHEMATFLTLYQPNKKALNYIRETQKLSTELKKDRISIETLLLYSKVYIEQGKTGIAYNYIEKALQRSKEKNDKNLIGESLIMMGYFYRMLGFYGYSLEYCLEANKYIPENDITTRFYLFSELGDVYVGINEYFQAINAFSKAYYLAKINNMPMLLTYAITKLSSVHIALGQYDKALTYLKQALYIANSLKNNDFIKMQILSKFALTYFKEQNYTKALKEYKNVLKLCTRHNFKLYKVQTFLHMAHIYIRLKDYNHANEYLTKCSNASTDASALSEIHLKINDAYSKYYKAIHSYEMALEYHEKGDRIRHKLSLGKVANRIAILETKFRQEQNIKSNELLRQSVALKGEIIKSDQHFILFLIIISILILILTALFLILYYNKKRYVTKLNELNKNLEKIVEHRTDTLKRIIENLKTEVKERRKLQKLVQEISDREQSRIGHDIHDSLGQMLVGISFHGQALVKKLQKTGFNDLSQSAAKIVESASQASTQARDLAKMLAPVELKEEGLETSLQRFCSYIKNHYHIECKLNIKKNIKTLNFDIQTTTNIYRIIQEATSNVVKHAKADKVIILFDFTERSATLSVKDNGIGLSTNKDKSTTTGMGLTIMKTRSELLKGKLKVVSVPNKGTQIICSFPLNRKTLI